MGVVEKLNKLMSIYDINFMNKPKLCDRKQKLACFFPLYLRNASCKLHALASSKPTQNASVAILPGIY